MPTAAKRAARGKKGAVRRRDGPDDDDDDEPHLSSFALPSGSSSDDDGDCVDDGDDYGEASLHDDCQDEDGALCEYDTAHFPDDPRVLATVKLLAKTTGLKLPKAMRAEGFNEKDSKDARKQMWVRRRMGPNYDRNKKVVGRGNSNSGRGRGKGAPKPNKGTGSYETAGEGSDGTVYYALRSGAARIDFDASLFTRSNAEDDCDTIHPKKKRKRDAMALPSPAKIVKTTPIYVKIRSAIFIRWEDARRFVVGGDYAACHSLEEAREYLLAGEKKSFGGDNQSDDALETFVAAKAAGEVAGAGIGGDGAEEDKDADDKSGKIEAFVAARAAAERVVERGVDGSDLSKTIAAAAAAAGVAAAASMKKDRCNLDDSSLEQTANKVSDVTSTATKSSLNKKQAPKPRVASHWDLMYNDLAEYKRSNNGSIELPEPSGTRPHASSKAGKSQKRLNMLRGWIFSQKRQLVDWSRGHTDDRWCPGQKLDVNELDEERVQKLKEIGFSMPPTYDEMYARLAAHKAEMGALDVSCAVDKELYEWTAEQRKMLTAHYKGECVPLSEERIKNLESLGFKHGRINYNGHMGLVDTGLIERKWDAMMQALVKWKEDRGSFTFPDKLALKSDRSLKGWFERQKKEYKKLQNGEESTLTTRRLQKLMAVPGLNLNQRPANIPWEERMRSLREFKAEHGHCRPKKQTFLGGFVSNVRTFYRQRQEGKTNCLTDERVNDLLELGFEFSVGKVRGAHGSKYVSWEERFQALLAFKQEHGHVNVTKQHDAHLDVPLGNWVRDQRAAYQLMKKGKKTHMNPEKALRLSELGFIFDASRNKVLNKESSAAPTRDDAEE